MKNQLLHFAVLLAFLPSLSATVLIDSVFTSTSQINLTPFAQNRVVAAVNFTNDTVSSPGTSSLLGIQFEDVNGGVAADTFDFANQTGGEVYQLTANGTNAVLETRFAFMHERHNNGAPVSGSDASVANTILQDIHTLAHSGHPAVDNELILRNLTSNGNFYLQFFGGDEGWAAQTDFIVNGVNEGRWTSGNTTNKTVTFGFTTTSDAAGQLHVDMNIVSGNFQGIGGFIVLEDLDAANAAIPEPSSWVMSLLAMFSVAVTYRRVS